MSFLSTPSQQLVLYKKKRKKKQNQGFQKVCVLKANQHLTRLHTLAEIGLAALSGNASEWNAGGTLLCLSYCDLSTMSASLSVSVTEGAGVSCCTA